MMDLPIRPFDIFMMHSLCYDFLRRLCPEQLLRSIAAQKLFDGVTYLRCVKDGQAVKMGNFGLKKNLSPMLVSALPLLGSCAPATITETGHKGESMASVAHHDTADQAAGRKTLSTAFVRVGPDGLLTVGLRDRRMLVLRDVTLAADDYCGKLVNAGSSTKKFCGDYAAIVTAKPGGDSATPDMTSPTEAGNTRSR